MNLAVAEQHTNGCQVRLRQHLRVRIYKGYASMACGQFEKFKNEHGTMCNESGITVCNERDMTVEDESKLCLQADQRGTQAK